MTREEIETFVREMMRSDISGQFAMVGSADVIKAIVDKWEEDVNTAEQRGIDAGADGTAIPSWEK